MSFTIALCVNTSDERVLDKSITVIYTLSGTLKQGTSVITPTILIESDANITGCNYMVISTFGRSYFITDIKNIRNNLFEVTARVDVLSTYAAQIRACSGIVYRNQELWNLYLNDGSFKVYQDRFVITKLFPSGFTDSNFILSVAGG